jgi:hypothetical protein
VHRHAGGRCRAEPYQAIARPTGPYVCVWIKRTITSSLDEYREVYSPTPEDNSRCAIVYPYCLPVSLPVSAERLLDVISLVLSGQAYRPLGAPNGIRPEYTIISRDLNVNQVNFFFFVILSLRTDPRGSSQNPEMIAMALNTLGSFDFNGIVLVSISSHPYLINTFCRQVIS